MAGTLGFMAHEIQPLDFEGEAKKATDSVAFAAS